MVQQGAPSGSARLYTEHVARSRRTSLFISVFSKQLHDISKHFTLSISMLICKYTSPRLPPHHSICQHSSARPVISSSHVGCSPEAAVKTESLRHSIVLVLATLSLTPLTNLTLTCSPQVTRFSNQSSPSAAKQSSETRLKLAAVAALQGLDCNAAPPCSCQDPPGTCSCSGHSRHSEDMDYRCSACQRHASQGYRCCTLLMSEAFLSPCWCTRYQMARTACTQLQLRSSLP